MNTLDTRDLIDERNELQETVLDAYNGEFETDFADFDEINVALLGDDLGEVDYTEEEIPITYGLIKATCGWSEFAEKTNRT